jgi:hypothetical protein
MTFSGYVLHAAAKAEKIAAMLMPKLGGPTSARRLLLTTVIQKTLLLTNKWLLECFCSEVVNSKLSAYGVTGTISCVVTCCTVIGCGDGNSVLDIILGYFAHRTTSDVETSGAAS